MITDKWCVLVNPNAGIKGISATDVAGAFQRLGVGATVTTTVSPGANGGSSRFICSALIWSMMLLMGLSFQFRPPSAASQWLIFKFLRNASNNCAASLSSSRPFSKSGRFSQVFPSACCFRQRRISSWLPDSNTGGTSSPATDSGRE